MNEGAACFLLQFTGTAVGVVVHALHELDTGAVALGVLHLRDRRAVRDADDSRNPAALGCERDALGVIARRARDDALRLLDVYKRQVIQHPDVNVDVLQLRRFVQILYLVKVRPVSYTHLESFLPIRRPPLPY